MGTVSTIPKAGRSNSEKLAQLIRNTVLATPSILRGLEYNDTKLEARFEVGKQLLDYGLLPVHSCMTEEGVLIIGGSGSGKSYLAEQMGFTVISNDFGFVSPKGDFFRLDYLDKNKYQQTKRFFFCSDSFPVNQDRVLGAELAKTKVQKLILFSQSKVEQRDIWNPEEREVVHTISASHPVFPEEAISQERELIKTLYAASNDIVAIQANNTYGSASMYKVLWNQLNQEELHRIHIMGLGRIGKSLLAMLLSRRKYSVGVYSKSPDYAKAVLRDFRNGLGRERLDKLVQIVDTDSLLECDMLIITTSTQEVPVAFSAEIPERPRKEEANKKLLNALIDSIRKNSFCGKVVLVSNPVEELCEYLLMRTKEDMHKNRLLSNQIVGTGPGVDKTRAEMYLADHSIGYDQLTVSGRHSGTIKVSVIKEGVVLGKISAEVNEFIQMESRIVRDELKNVGLPPYVQRTIYGPIQDIFGLVQAFGSVEPQVFSCCQADGRFSASYSYFFWI
jgi:malate/lactate dehydrogenase